MQCFRIFIILLFHVEWPICIIHMFYNLYACKPKNLYLLFICTLLIIFFQGLFVGKTTGKVFVCQESDDYQEQSITCVGYSMEHFLTVGPQRLLEYNKPQCMFDNCYGCFDPLLKDRVFGSMGLPTKQ
jgi:hypothetical protein